MGILALAFCGVASGQTQVPNDFTAGTPARAAEVNENFTTLEQAVQQLESSTNLSWMGDWQNGVSYDVDDLVQFQGSASLAVQATSGAEDPTDTGFWSLFAAHGADGATGQQGPTGDTGATGPQGPDGPQGLQGPQGVQGVPGPQGDQGSVGPAGIQGPQGDAGPQGIQGNVGPQGPEGSPGLASPQLVVVDANGQILGPILQVVNYAACCVSGWDANYGLFYFDLGGEHVALAAYPDFIMWPHRKYYFDEIDCQGNMYTPYFQSDQAQLVIKRDSAVLPDGRTIVRPNYSPSARFPGSIIQSHGNVSFDNGWKFTCSNQTFGQDIQLMESIGTLPVTTPPYAVSVQ